MEISAYSSKRDFLKIKEKLGNNKEIDHLFNKFLKIVYKRRIIEKEVHV